MIVVDQWQWFYSMGPLQTHNYAHLNDIFKPVRLPHSLLLLFPSLPPSPPSLPHSLLLPSPSLLPLSPYLPPPSPPLTLSDMDLKYPTLSQVMTETLRDEKPAADTNALLTAASTCARRAESVEVSRKNRSPACRVSTSP